MYVVVSFMKRDCNDTGTFIHIPAIKNYHMGQRIRPAMSNLLSTCDAVKGFVQPSSGFH